MGSEIKDFVQVNITKETGKITRAGFGTALILGPSFVFPERVKSYSDPSEMLSDGFLTTDSLYKAALKLQGQALASPTFKIGRKFENVNAKQKFAFSATPDSGSFTITLGAETTGAIAFNAATGVIQTSLQALTGITAVTVTGAIDAATGVTVEFTGADANTAFSAMTATSSLLIGAAAVTITPAVLQNGSTVETWDTALNAVEAFDADWYTLVATTRINAEVNLLADIIQTKSKIYVAASNDADIKTNVTTDTASILKGKSLDRTAILWSGDQANFPEAAWVGGRLPVNPGRATWKFKPLAGIAADALTTTELTNLRSKNANFYETVSGLSFITSEAVMAAGDFIDNIRGTDWLTARISERILTVLVNSDKIPMTAQGIAVFENEIKSQLEIASGVDFPLLRKETIVVNVPKIEDIPTADKLIRLLNNITFSAKYQQAVHKLGIFGKISV